MLQQINIVLNNTCTCRCALCDIWREPSKAELPVDIVHEAISAARSEGATSVLLTGGEPTLHSAFLQICAAIGELGMKATLCTDGLDLAAVLAAATLVELQVMVSCDGHDNATYKRTRGVDGFESVVETIRTLKQRSAPVVVELSHLIQRHNYRHLTQFVDLAHALRVDSLSLKVPDSTYGSFGGAANLGIRVNARPPKGTTMATEQLLAAWTHDRSFDKPLIAQSRSALERYGRYLDALMNGHPYEAKRVCTIPDWSMVVDVDATARPCFYLPVDLGNVSQAREVLRRRDSLLRSSGRVEAFRELACDACVQCLGSDAVS